MSKATGIAALNPSYTSAEFGAANSTLAQMRVDPLELSQRINEHPRKHRQKKSRPVSRVLSWTVIPLGTASPPCSSNLPGNDAGRVIVPLFGLAPSGVCLATRRCPRVRCALTAPFHPYHACLATPFGGLFSVALSVDSRRPGVTWHPALWSPDFPRSACAPRDCLADSACRIQGTGTRGQRQRSGIGNRESGIGKSIKFSSFPKALSGNEERLPTSAPAATRTTSCAVPQ